MTVVVILALIVAVIVLFARVRRLSQGLKELRRDLYVLKQRPAQQSPHVIPGPEEKKPGTPGKQIVKPLLKRPSAPAIPARSRSEWEALIGGKYLNRIGAVALVLGAGFFLKSAYDNNWFSETVRVLIVAVYGLVLIQLGTLFYHKAKIFAQGVMGTGISVLYVAVYASFNYYQLVGQIIAFCFLFLITALAFYYALRYKALTVAVLGWFGGYVSPLFLQTASPNELNLFVYLFMTSVGILAIVYKNRDWFVLEPLVLLAAFAHFFYWYALNYVTAKFTIAAVFVSVFWLLFYLDDLLTAVQKTDSFAAQRRFLAYLNVSLYYIALYVLVDDIYPGWMGRTTFALAGIYLISSLAVKKLGAGSRTHVVQQHLSAIVLLVLATTIQYRGYTTVVLWGLEAFILTVLAVRYKLNYVRICAFLLYAVLLIKLVPVEYILNDHFFKRLDLENYSFILNRQDFTVIFILLSLAASRFVNKTTDKSGPFYNLFFEYGFLLLLLVFCSVETLDFLTWYTKTATHACVPVIKNYQVLLLAMVWFFYTIPAVSLGLRYKINAPVYTGLLVLLLAHFMLLPHVLGEFSPVEKFNVLLNLRALALLVFAGGLLYYAFYLRHHEKDYWFLGTAGMIVRYVLIFLLFVLISVEIRDLFAEKMLYLRQSTDITDFQDARERLNNLKHLLLSAGWIGYAIVLLFLGIWRKVTFLRTVAFILLGVAICKIFIFDLSYLETSYRFVLFVGLGMILLGVSFLYQRLKSF